MNILSAPFALSNTDCYIELHLVLCFLKFYQPKDEYKKLSIFELTLKGTSHIRSLKVEDFPYYHPADALMEIEPQEDKIYMFSRHPGFLDDYVLAESSCTIPRVKDVEMLCDPRIKKWIIDNKIELINHRDALYGTNEYQEYLKSIDSELAV